MKPSIEDPDEIYEAPPVYEESWDDDFPIEHDPCENCIFRDSIMCDICNIPM